MSQRNDDGGDGSLILLILLICIIANQCSVDDRLDKIENKFTYEVSRQ